MNKAWPLSFQIFSYFLMFWLGQTGPIPSKSIIHLDTWWQYFNKTKIIHFPHSVLIRNWCFIFSENTEIINLISFLFCFVFCFFCFCFVFISWRLITLQYCSGFYHTLTWISLRYICIPHPDPPSHLPLHSIPLGLPSAPGLSTCLMHPTWAGDLFHPR